MEKVGVEAVVAGLTSFLGDMKQVDKAITGLVPGSNLLKNAFSALGDTVNGLVNFALNSLAHAIGELVADAVGWLITQIRDLIQTTIEAGTEFQRLEIRLRRLNFNQLRESGMEYNEAMSEAIRLTKEQLQWTLLLGATTAYKSADIARVFTMANAYGFNADEAKTLTEQIVDFSSGMGLTSQEMERIIINFGQMRSQSKLNAQDLRDLGRGSFLPINRLLELTQDKLGVTTGEFEKMRKAGKLGSTAVEAFVMAFGELVGTDFEGAAGDMNRVLTVAISNVQELFSGLAAYEIVAPIFERISEAINSFMEIITQPAMFERLSSAMSRIGDTISQIIGSLGMDLSGGAEGFVGMFENIATWLEDHKTEIVDFFIGIGDTINNKIVPFITDTLMPAFEKISTWVSENKDTILEFFNTVGDIVHEVFSDLTSQLGKPSGEGGFLETLTGFMKFVIENKDEIVKWIEILWSVFIVLNVLNVIFSVVGSVLAWIAGIIAVGALAWALFGSAIAVVMPVILLIIAVILSVILQIKFLQWQFEMAKNAIGIVIDSLKRKFTEWKENIRRTFEEISNAIKNKDWWGVGRAVVDGIWRGIKNNYYQLLDLARELANNFINTFKETFGIHSPSELTYQMGENLMQGFAAGILESAGLAAVAMKQAIGAMISPAMLAPQLAYQAATSPTTANTYQSTNNYNLQINSNAQTEPVVQDFNMMKSLIG